VPRRKDVLCVLAHQDDELVMSPRIARDVASGHRVSCVYLTDGSAGEAASDQRDAESLRVLAALGVDPGCVHFLGSRHAIPDGELPLHLGTARRLLEDVARDVPVRRVYTMAYEGGHQDHDAAHLVALAFAHSRGLVGRTWQLPMYHGFRRPWILFRVSDPLHRGKGVLQRRLAPMEGLRHSLLMRHHSSQWRTWVGLAPGLVWGRAAMRREWLLPVDTEAVRIRPHPGPLLYERLFGFSYDTFREAAERELDRVLASPSLDPRSRPEAR